MTTMQDQTHEFITVLGVRIRVAGSTAVCNELVGLCAARRCVKVYIPNAATLNLACGDPPYRQLLNEGDYVLRDGIGLQIAACLQKERFPENLVGTDLVPMLCKELAKRGKSVYLLGGKPGIAEKAGAKLQALCPGLRIAGCQHGYFDKEALHEVTAAISDSAPDLLLVAFGNPLQEQWIHHHAPELNAGVAIGVGGLFDHLAGELTRAPLWMRKHGLEWLYILLGQPYKWRRYVLGNPLFLARIAAERIRVAWSHLLGRTRCAAKHFLRWFLCIITTRQAPASTADAPDTTTLRIITYHDILDVVPQYDPFSVSTRNFTQQMEVLAKDWNVVSLTQALEAFRQNLPLPPKAVAVTFDDGYRGVLENAAPVLRRLKLPATLFLRCDVLDTGRPKGDPNPASSYLTWEEAKSLPHSGFEIGSHTLRHRPLSSLPNEEAEEEIIESKRLLEQELRSEIQLFSYPYGTGREYNAWLMRCVKEAGYDGAVTSVNGVNTYLTDKYTLRRTKVERHDSLDTFKRLLCGGMDCWRFVDEHGSILQERG